MRHRAEEALKEVLAKYFPEIDQEKTQEIINYFKERTRP